MVDIGSLIICTKVVCLAFRQSLIRPFFGISFSKPNLLNEKDFTFLESIWSTNLDNDNNLGPKSW